MPDLDLVLAQLRTATRTAMRRRRSSLPGSEAYRRADELVAELLEATRQLGRALERRQARPVMQPVRVRTR
jgi:hypothetical protein